MKSGQVVSCLRWLLNHDIAQHPERNDANNMRSPDVESKSSIEPTLYKVSCFFLFFFLFLQFVGKSLKTITNVKTDDKAIKLHKKIHYNTEKINLNKQHNLAELSATSGRQRIRRQRREIMISDKLYSNHTVLIPSKKGVGGRSGLMV